jgi:hypothetical protein
MLELFRSVLLVAAFTAFAAASAGAGWAAFGLLS